MAEHLDADVQQPQPNDVPTDGQNEAFHGTNPWSGPYLVLAIIVPVLLGIAGIVIAVFWRASTG